MYFPTHLFPSLHLQYLRLPWWLRQQSICLQCGRPGFNPWVGKIPWRRKWQSTPVFLPEKSHGRRSLVGYSPWGHKESDTTERLHFHFLFIWNSIFKIIKLLLKCSDIAVSCVGACLHCWISSTWHTDESLESSGEWPKLIHFDEFIHLFTHLLKKKIIEDFFYVRQIHVFICLYNTDIKSVP